MRSRRHKAILVNKAARPVGWSVEGDSVGLRLPPLPLPRPDPITQLFLSLNNLLSLFGEVSSSCCLSLMPYFMPLAYNKTERGGGEKEGGAVNR